MTNLMIRLFDSAPGRSGGTWRASLSCAASLRVLSAAALSAGLCIGGDAWAQSVPDSSEVDAIVVTGIRASLKSAIETKRQSSNFVDAIVAEDIADFPDLNLGEALQRISGVTINRVAGEGQRITVRGLAPEFTRITLNGITVMSGNSGREVDFDAFASELFSAALVHKTPTADMAEGALAATVDLRTPRPLDLGDRLTVSAQGSYNDLSQFTDPRGSIVASKTFADGTLGVLASASYSRRRARFDTIEGFRWAKASFDTNSDGTADVLGVDYAVQPRVLTQLHDRERLGLSGTVQFQPNDAFELSVDGFYASFDDDIERYDLQASMTTAPRMAQVTVANGNVISGTFPNILQQSESILQIQPEEISVISAKADWDVSPDLNLSARVGYSEGTGSVEDIRVVYAATSNISYAVRDRAAVLTSATDLANPANFRHNLTIWNIGENKNDTLTGRIDAAYGSRWSFLPKISGGLEFGTRKIERTNRARTLTAQTAPLVSPVYQTFRFDNFLSGFDVPGVLNNFATANVRAAMADTRIFPTTFAPAADPINTFEVSEDTAAAYLRADLSGQIGGFDVTADVGIRYARTKQRSEGSRLVGTAFQPVLVEREYEDVLPAANVRIELRDNLILRFAASKAMSRPALLDLSPRQTIAPVTFRANVGNPELDPYRVSQFDAALEWYVGAEGLLSGTVFKKDIQSFVVNVTTREPVFGEGLFDGLGNNVSGKIFDVTKPVNGTGGEVSGIELSYQQPFTFLPAPFDGLGMLANYTYADSSIQVTLNGQLVTTRLSGQSPHFFNLVGYYEKGPVGMRVAYSWRDAYVFNIRSNTRLETQDAYGQVDMSAHYVVNDRFQVTVDAINLTGEKNYLYDGQPSRPMVYSDVGSTLLFGLRARF